MDADSIYETEVGTYISEPNIKLSLTEPKHVNIYLSSPSSTGSATVYIEFTRTPHDSNIQ